MVYMKFDRYVSIALVLIIGVFLSYFIHFYIRLGYQISSSSADWAQLGDYAGGVLNPFLSFISIVLLIKSLSLQNVANQSLRDELKNNERTEKLRSFETLFFNLISSQKNLFDAFYIITSDGSGGLARLKGVDAVFRIEDEIQKMRDKGLGNEDIKACLEKCDGNDQIFGLSRGFYVIVLAISERLNDSRGFTLEDRRSHYMALVNFTDFSLLRLIMIYVQFMDYESCKYLRSSIEFKEILEELNLSYELY